MQQQKSRKWLAKPVARRIYYKLCLETAQPLLIGSGEDDAAVDLPISVDAFGQAYLPGSALAGAAKETTRRCFGEAVSERLFGEPLQQTAQKPGHQSQVFVYDAVFSDAEIAFRDGVRLDAYKTAEDRAKYDMQVLLPGAKAEAFLQVAQRQDSETAVENDHADLEKLEQMLRYLLERGLYIGAKKNRGFGWVKVTALHRRSFRMADEEERKAWLDWDFRKGEEAVFQKRLTGLGKEAAASMRLEHQLTVPLEVAQTLLVRCYPAGFSEQADYMPLLAPSSGEEKQPVIPGNSWIGAIRSRIAKIMMQFQKKSFAECQELLAPVFGSWSKKTGEVKIASLVAANESVVKNAHLLPVTRTSIDRFTGGTISGNLYTGQIVVRGNTKLQLRWPCEKGKSELTKRDKIILGLLLWAVRDLQEGLLAVGGETAVGRGIFKGNREEIDLNGKCIYSKKTDSCSKEAEKYMGSAANWCRNPKEF